MREIILINNKGIILVDDEDYNFLNQFRWYLRRSNKRNNQLGYAQTPITINRKQTSIIMHKILIDIPNGMVIDHINHNTFDNRKSNLRIVTKSQNQMNKLPQKGKISKFKGVNWDKNLKKWKSRCSLNRKQYYLGLFEDEIDAARAYNIKAKELHGEYAYLNEV